MTFNVKKYGSILIFSLPLLVYWVTFTIVRPSQNYYINDPEFAYFMNSLGAFKGIPFAYYDHPGTPLSMIGVVLLALTYPFIGGTQSNYINYHISHYWVFLNLAQIFVMFLHATAVWQIYTKLQKTEEPKQPLIAAMFAVMYFAVHSFSMTATLLWEHNGFSFPVGSLLLLGLYLALDTTDKKEISNKTLVSLGLGAGFMAAFTIYMAAWFVGITITLLIFLVLQRYQLKSIFLKLVTIGALGVAGFFAGILPIFAKLRGFIGWVLSILTHQSKYLSVPNDEPRSVRMLENLKYIFESWPLLVVIPLFLFGLMLFMAIAEKQKKSPRGNGMVSMAWGLGIQYVLLTLIFVDRPVREFYLLSLAAIIPFWGIATFELLKNRILLQKLVLYLCIAVTSIGLLFTTWQSFSYKEWEISTLAESEQVVQQTIQKEAVLRKKAPQDLMVLWMQGTFSHCWRLWYGNRRSDNAFAGEVSAQCPNQYEFAGRVWFPYSKVPLEETKWDIIFTCSKLVDAVFAKDQTISTKEYPNIVWSCGPMAVITNK